MSLVIVDASVEYLGQFLTEVINYLIYLKETNKKLFRKKFNNNKVSRYFLNFDFVSFIKLKLYFF